MAKTEIILKIAYMHLLEEKGWDICFLFIFICNLDVTTATWLIWRNFNCLLLSAKKFLKKLKAVSYEVQGYIKLFYVVQTETKKIPGKTKMKNSKHVRFTVIFWERALKKIAMKQTASLIKFIKS